MNLEGFAWDCTVEYPKHHKTSTYVCRGLSFTIISPMNRLCSSPQSPFLNKPVWQPAKQQPSISKKLVWGARQLKHMEPKTNRMPTNSILRRHDHWQFEKWMDHGSRVRLKNQHVANAIFRKIMKFDEVFATETKHWNTWTFNQTVCFNHFDSVESWAVGSWVDIPLAEIHHASPFFLDVFRSIGAQPVISWHGRADTNGVCRSFNRGFVGRPAPPSPRMSLWPQGSQNGLTTSKNKGFYCKPIGMSFRDLCLVLVYDGTHTNNIQQPPTHTQEKTCFMFSMTSPISPGRKNKEPTSLSSSLCKSAIQLVQTAECSTEHRKKVLLGWL